MGSGLVLATPVVVVRPSKVVGGAVGNLKHDIKFRKNVSWNSNFIAVSINLPAQSSLCIFRRSVSTSSRCPSCRSSISISIPSISPHS